MSILKEFASQETAVRENTDMNLALNTLRAIQESSEVVGKFVYEASMLPIFSLDNYDKPVYCVEADMFKKMLDSKQLTIQEGIEELYNYVSEQCDDCESKENLAIAFTRESIDEIDRVTRSDPSRYSARCEAVIHQADVMEAIIREGVSVVNII